MATLREIRRRLQSIKNIQQLTRAMEMVAASRLHFAHLKAKQAQPYISKMQELASLLGSIPADFTHPFFEQRQPKKIGLMIFAADMGLCGGYNKDVLSAANQFLTKYEPSQIQLILIGQKAINYYKHRQWPILFQMLEGGEKTTFLQIKKLSHQLTHWFLSRELDEIWFVYSHYISMSSREVIVKKFLNIERSHEKNIPMNYLFEPSLDKVYHKILSRYCLSTVQTAFSEAYASELAARIFAMKAATKNADEMIQKLTLLRNKVRQSGITKEMIEITSGGMNNNF